MKKEGREIRDRLERTEWNEKNVGRQKGETAVERLQEERYPSVHVPSKEVVKRDSR